MPVSNSDYQGTIFRSPFFFLLVDSFFLSSFVPFCAPSCAGAASALAASLGCPAPAAASVLGVPSAVAAASVPPPFAESAVAGGAFGSAVAFEFGAFPSVGAATFSAAPAVPLLPPGVTVATMPVPVPDFLVWSPPAKISTPADVSDSGSNVGFPTREATCSSRPGLEESHRFLNQAGALARCILLRGHPRHRFRIRLRHRRSHRLQPLLRVRHER